MEEITVEQQKTQAVIAERLVEEFKQEMESKLQAKVEEVESQKKVRRKTLSYMYSTCSTCTCIIMYYVMYSM